MAEAGKSTVKRLSYLKNTNVSHYESKPDGYDTFHRAYRFSFKLGSVEASFRSISGLETGIDVDTYQEGGVNDYVHIFTKPASQPGRIILEKGSGRKDPFFSGGKPVIGFRFSEPAIISLLADDLETPLRTYTVYSPIIVKLTASDLNAVGSELNVDRLEILHNGIEVSEV